MALRGRPTFVLPSQRHSRIVQMNIQQIPVSQITLDERNPRVAHIMEGVTDGNLQDLIPLALGQHAPESEDGGSSTTYSSLKASIRAHGGLIMPVIVTPRGDGTYTVAVEGKSGHAYRVEWGHVDSLSKVSAWR